VRAALVVFQVQMALKALHLLLVLLLRSVVVLGATTLVQAALVVLVVVLQTVVLAVRQHLERVMLAVLGHQLVVA
jgi:hypothetical protein